jgi:hypothetical protein
MGDEPDNLPISDKAATAPLAAPAEEMKAVPEPSDDTGGGAKKRSDFASVVFGGFFYLVIGLVWVWNSSQAQNFLLRNRWLLGVITALALVAMGIAWVRRDMIEATAKRKIALIIFVTIPILLALLGAVMLLSATYQVALLRSVFLLIVCLLPATMYYLFIASRKSSLLQEYFTNLARLGLFDPQKVAGIACTANYEDELKRRVRVMSYIQKFNAAYGPIPTELAHDILEATSPDNSEPKVPDFDKYASGGALGAIFTPETAIPVVLTTLLIGLGWILTLPPWGIVDFPSDASITLYLKYVLQPQETTVYFAFLGAYFFSLQMLFRRYVRKDLRANAYIAVSMRIILAVLGTWAVIQAVELLQLQLSSDVSEHRALLVVGFVIGAFPPVAWQVIQAAFRTLTGAKYLVPSLNSDMPVSGLDGLTVWHEARLEEEDIENIPNMATADIVELMLNTRIPPDRIVDWVDQAMLCTHLGPGNHKQKNKTPNTGEMQDSTQKNCRELLREHGIRTASDLLTAYEKSKEHEDLALFETLLPGQGRSKIRGLVDTLSSNPNLAIVQRWQWQCRKAQQSA